MNFLQSISAILKDPPPAFAFEISKAGIAMARLDGKAPEIVFEPLPDGVISVSPLRDNILMPDELASAVRAIAPPNGNRKRRDAALILPDYCTRVSVLDFDNFPSDPKEQLPLVRFRIKKSVPFDVESAALSFWPQPGSRKEEKLDVVSAVAPLEIISRYEAPFRAAGLNPGLVTISSLSALHLVEDVGVNVVAKLTGQVLTVLVLDKGLLKLIRCLELAEEPGVGEIAADLYPTFVYIEDNLQAKAERLLLCGFGRLMEEARRQFQPELGIEVEPLRSPLGIPGENDAGLLGYLKSLGQT